MSHAIFTSILFDVKIENFDLKNNSFERAGFSRAETQKVLTSIASNLLVDEGDVVNAFELFWTPGDGTEVLTTRDVIVDFPELIDL